MDGRIMMKVLILFLLSILGAQSKPSFTVDYEHDTFLRDGKPFRYVSGSIHYFRVPREYWKDRLQKLRASGANAVQTYIEWSSHEPEPGKYSFEGDNDVIAFIKEAQALDLLVILRPGPYVCAERDLGGFPYWLKRINPNMKLRTSDPSFMKAVDTWFSVLLPKIRPLLYSNGGPVISIQVENEYGFFGCDKVYLGQLRDIVKKHLGNDDVILFTTDGWNDAAKCGNVEGTLATIDFGPGTNPEEAFEKLRKIQPKGPFVNSEYYPGWLDHWAEPHHVVPSNEVTKTFDKMLALNASVNFYMFHGGTSFGFTAGTNGGDPFQPQLTSYDYDAPLSEAGDPTEKFFEIQNVIKKYLPLPPLPKPTPNTKGNYGSVDSSCYLGDIFQFVDEFAEKKIESETPLSFEALSQPNGFVLYTTKVPIHPNDPSLLKVPGLKDRAHVFVNRKIKGILSRELKVFELPLTDVKEGDEIAILVENQGRICIGGDADFNEIKGISDKVLLDNMPLTKWTNQKVPLDEKVISKWASKGCQQIPESQKFAYIPSFFKAIFKVNCVESLDTFFKLDNWRKGNVFVNGFNLGRYWPVVGPQETLYVPKYRLKPSNQENEIVIFELEFSPHVVDEGRGRQTLHFVDTPLINSSTPYRAP